MKSGLVKVKAIRLKNGKFQYIGVQKDGSEVVLRKGATRLYDYAFYYEDIVCTGASGMSMYFTFGKAPSATYSYGKRVQPLETFKVEEAPC